MNPIEIEIAGLVAIIRASKSEGVVEAAHIIVRGGVRVLEVTLNTPDALQLIAVLRSELQGNAFVGAGTVLDIDDAKKTLDAGAQFIVTPTLQLETIAFCRECQLPILCGCLTPTEALAAHREGADFIKIFPATTFGPAYVRDVLAPLPFLRMVPTGGVTIENLRDFFGAGCAAVAIGSQLVSSEILTSKNWDSLEAKAAQFVALVAQAKAKV